MLHFTVVKTNERLIEYKSNSNSQLRGWFENFVESQLPMGYFIFRINYDDTKFDFSLPSSPTPSSSSSLPHT